jgi:long-chain fatty acid transport protein
MTRTRRIVGAAVVFLAAWSTSRDASASGFAAAHFGGEEGTVLATNPTSLYYNPAGMGFSEGIHLYLDGEIALRSATWTHTATNVSGLDANAQYGNSGKAALFNVFAGPALGATIQLGEHLVVGAGLFVPFGGRVRFGSNTSVPTSSPSVTNGMPAPGYQGCADPNAPVCPLAAQGVQRWHISTAALTFLYATAGAALKFGPLSIGAAGNFINSEISETQAHDISNQVDSTGEYTANLNVQGNNGSFSAGVMLEVVPEHLWLAGSYQAQPGMGPQTLGGTLNYNQGPAGYYSQSGNSKYNVDFHESLPDIFRAGIRGRFGPVELRAFGDYTRWSVMTNQCINISTFGSECKVYGPGGGTTYPDGGDATPHGSVLTNIPRNWNNTWSARLGASYFASPAVEIFAGGGYETAAVPNSTLEPGAMDANNILASLGGRFMIADRFWFALSYTQIQFQNRTVTNSTLDSYVTPGTTTPTVSYSESGNGSYTQWIGVIDVNAEKQF